MEATPEPTDRTALFQRIPPEYLEPLRTQRSFIAVFCLSAILSALTLTYVASDEYQAASALLYRPQNVTTLGVGTTETTQAFGSPVPPPSFKIIGNTLEDAVKSQRVLRPVVLRLGLHLKPVSAGDAPWYERLYQGAKDLAQDLRAGGWQLLRFGRLIDADPIANAMGKLREEISITSNDSYIFVLKVRDKYPQRAAAAADALAEELVRWIHEEEKSPGEMRRAQLEALLGDVSLELDGIRGEIEEVLTQNDVVSVDAETAEGIQRLSELEADRVRLEGEIEAARRSLEEKSRRMEQARDALEGSGRGLMHPDDYRRLISERTFEEIELRGKVARYESLARSVDELQGRLGALPAIQTHLGGLATELASAERRYVLISDKYADAVILATEQESETRILHAALVPDEPVAPIKIYHVGLAGFLALFASVGLVFLLTFLNVRVLFASSGAEGRRPPPPEPEPPPKRTRRVRRKPPEAEPPAEVPPRRPRRKRSEDAE